MSIKAAAVTHFNASDPAEALEVILIDDPAENLPDGWTVVDVKAATINHHDVWSLRGVGLRAEQLPIVLGTDAAGVTAEGREVIVFPAVGSNRPEDAAFAPERRTILSEKYNGTFASKLAIPESNLVDKPINLTFEEAAALPTAWLTAYNLVFGTADLKPGQTVLVQGASGGVSSAAIALAAAAGIVVYATGRTQAKRDYALSLGAKEAVENGARLPVRVDAVIETVGAATWKHSIRSVRDHGVIAIAGATTGDGPAEFSHIFFRDLTIRGTTGGSISQLRDLVRFVEEKDLHPHIDRILPLDRAADGFRVVEAGDHFGKVVIQP